MPTASLTCFAYSRFCSLILCTCSALTVTSCVTADNCEIFSTILLLESERPAISLLTTSICSISVSIFLLSCSNVCAASIILSPCSLVASTEELTDTTTSSALSLSSLVILVISSVKFFVCSANCLICSATTAKPLPASPALALSIEALSAKRLVSFQQYFPRS